jgi:uncharacterized surface protein with fasciclin (FAS1) repeats
LRADAAVPVRFRFHSPQDLLPPMECTMKTRLLSIALLAALAAAGCARDDAAAADAAAPAEDAMASADPAADSAMAADTAATDAMAPAADAVGSNPMVGGAPMDATKDIVTNASASADHTTLVKAVQAAGLVDTLKGTGPFTVFAPTNAAFEALPAGTVEGLLQPDKKQDLTSVLTYHVVPGNVDSAALTAQIEAGGGKAVLKTVQGAELTATAEGGNVVITDAKGNKATVTTADVRQSNGVVHVVDKVLLPS